MEDFIRVMDENPSWRDAVRERVLTRELLELPERFAEYTRENNARMATFELRMEALEARVKALEARIEALDLYVQEQFAIVNERFDALERRLGTFERDMGYFRARHASEIVRSQSLLVARELGCVLVKELSINDLVIIEDQADTSGIPVNDLQSFRRADLVMETVRRETDETCYIAVEISYTVNGRDTSRAIRNAGFLRRFTGEDALAVVAGVRKDYRVDDDIAANNVSWYGLDEQDLGTG